MKRALRTFALVVLTYVCARMVAVIFTVAMLGDLFKADGKRAIFRYLLTSFSPGVNEGSDRYLILGILFTILIWMGIGVLMLVRSDRTKEEDGRRS